MVEDGEAGDQRVGAGLEHIEKDLVLLLARSPAVRQFPLVKQCRTTFAVPPRGAAAAFSPLREHGEHSPPSSSVSPSLPALCRATATGGRPSKPPPLFAAARPGRSWPHPCPGYPARGCPWTTLVVSVHGAAPAAVDHVHRRGSSRPSRLPPLSGSPTGGAHLSGPSPSSSRRRARNRCARNRRRVHASASFGPRSPPHRAVAAIGFAWPRSTPSTPLSSRSVAGEPFPSCDGEGCHVVPVAVRRVSTSLRRSSSPDAAVPSGEDSFSFPLLPRFPGRRRRPRSPSPLVVAAVHCRRFRVAFAPSPPPPDAVAGNATRACRRR
uniref:Uncharacterized protein n=1 Tax=Oryza sativa subsp. japonica TaxID=39947 RepID=Q69PQ0_ORYSJ|nr:hypothetical protein [Oryza sativa Japonica Group]BAD31512.1 hypothetical protein [Oryza sativa Japonica Group]